MADIDKKISELVDADPVTTGDKLVVVQGGTTKKIDAIDFKGDIGSDGPTGPGDADTVSMNEVASGGTIDNVQSMHTRINSSGVYSGGDVTDNGDGTIAISAGQGLIRATDNITSDLLTADFSAVSSLSLTDNENNFIYIQYNGGNPNTVATITERTDINTNILLSIIFRSGTDLHIFNPSKHIIGDAINSALIRFKETRPFERASGALISATGTRNFAVTSGKFWEGLTPFNTDAINLAVSGSFVYIHRDGSSGFTETSSQTQIDNTQYDDGSGTLATLSNNLYGVHWVFLESDGDYLVMYGQGDFTLSQAEADTIPAALPKRLQTTGRLVGKIVIQENASVFISTESAFVEAFETSTPTDHNQLVNLQGGNATERFHLTQSEIDNIALKNSNQTFQNNIQVNGQGHSPTNTLTDAATIATNCDLGNVHTVVLTANRTLGEPTNLKNGATYIWIIKQDATGSRTLAYDSVFKFEDGTAPILSTGANKVDILSAVSDGTNVFAQLIKDFR